MPDVGRLSGNCPRFEYRGAERQFEITEVLNVDYVAMPGQPAKAWAKVTYVDGSNKQDVAFFAESEGLLGVLELAGGSQEIVALFRNCLETQAPIPTLTATVATTLTPSPTATPQPTATVTPLEVLKPTYPCEAEFISPRGVSPVMITFRQRPNEGNSGTQSYQPGDRVIIKQADESGNWYLVAELNNLERGWASAEYFTDCSKNVD